MWRDDQHLSQSGQSEYLGIARIVTHAKGTAPNFTDFATNRELARKNLLRFQLQIYWAHSDSVGRISAIQ